MALTKVQTIGIETGISLTGVTTVTTLNASTDTLSVGGTVNFGGNVSIAGTLTYEDVTNIDAVGLITARNGIKVDDLGVQVGTGATVDSAGNNILTFLTNGSERLRIDSSGRLLVGASSNISGLGGFNLQMGGVVAASSIAQATFENDNEGPIHRFYHSRNATVGSHTIVQDDDQLGQIQFHGSDGTNIVQAARILCNVDGTPGTNDMPGRITFQTTADGASSPTERMRIQSDGKVLIGHTSNIFSYKLAIFGTDGGNSGISASRFSNNTSPSSLILSKSRGTSIGSYTIVQDDDEVGMIDFRASDGTDNNSQVARIKAEIDGTPGSNDMPGRLTFHTTADGAASTTERLRIDSSGRIFFNETNSDLGHKYILSGNESADVAAFQYNSNTGTYLAITTGAPNGIVEIKADARSGSFPPLTFKTGANERMRIDSSGNMGLGTASPSAKLHVAGVARIGANDTSSATLEIGAGATGNRNAILDLVGDTTYTDYGLRLIRNNGGANTISALVHRGTSGLQINAQDAGNIQFLTSNTERARITSSGDFGLGISSPTKKLHVSGEAFITGNTFFHSTDTSAILAGTAIGKYFQTDGNLISGKTTTNGNTHQAFCNPNGIVGTIRTSGSATQYNTSSDYRLKENVVDITDGITRVKQLQPRRFNFITDADTIVDGFIAHEAQTVVPEAVSGTHNEVDDDGNAVMQGIDASKLVPLLTAALQEEIAKREALEARIAALEG